MVAIVSIPVRDIRVADIHASPLNPRKHFDAGKLSELADNLRDAGQMEAITVRPSASQPGKFELVNGERRWRAAQLAKLETLAAKVREMTDSEALAIMLITGAEGNVEALTPLEEAGGYRDAMRIMGLSLEGLARRFGRSISDVQRKLALLDLPTESRRALESGELAPRTAYEIARIPSLEKREEAEKAILHSEVHGGVMPQRAAKLYIEKQICRTLQGAPFDAADKELVKSAGPCTTCPWRAGNNRETYGDVKNPHTCMNPTCFESKIAAARERVLAKETKNGKEPLSPAANSEVFPAGEKGVSWKSEYVAFTQPVPRDLLKPEVTKCPTWTELCSDRGIKVYVGIDQAGRAVDVVKLSEAMVAIDPKEAAIFSDVVRRRYLVAAAPSGTAPARAPGKKKKQSPPTNPGSGSPEKRPDDPRTVMLGHALFAPGEHPHCIEVRLADTREAFRAVCGEADWKDDLEAFCRFDYDATGDNHGQLVFERATLTRPTIVHECVHAALSFVSHKVMASEAVLAMSDDEKDGYFQEAVARVTGNLFEQADELLFDGESPVPPQLAPVPVPVTEERNRLAEWTKARGLGMSAQKIAATYRVPLEDVCGALGLDVMATRNEFKQLQQDVETAFESVGILSEAVRDKTAKFACGGLRLADLTTPEQLRSVLRILSAKAAPLSTGKKDSETADEG